VELRGRLTDDRVQAAVASFARARFGAANVYVATVLDPLAPDGWPARVLAGLQALAQLDHGTLLVRPDTVEVAGVSGSQLASARISQLLSEGLGQGKTFKVNVSYDKELDPLAALPTPKECLDRMVAVVAARKISFDPGSAELDAASGAVLDDLAKAMKGCVGVKIEIGGHTDAQGSDGGNLALSQARAEAVLVALQGRQVDVSGMRAVGYGESMPIEDNGDEEGREANRRIAFTLIEDVAQVEGATENSYDAPGDEPLGATASTAGSADDGPSYAPKEKTDRPKPRPKE
jgi:OOP family OmpA-OmpF porin